MTTATTYSPQQIAGWLGQIVTPDQLIELRALHFPGGKKAACEFFPASQLEQLATRALELEALRPKSINFTLNPVRHDLRKNTRADDVLWRRWQLIDIDPTRPPDTSASNAEHAAAWEVADTIRRVLLAEGLGVPFVGNSGNGWHLLLPVHLPNDEPSYALCRALLKALAARCDTPAAHVGVECFNADRLCRLYGTMARKGQEELPERPHRRSCFHGLMDAGQLQSWPSPEACAAQITNVLARWQRGDELRSGRPEGDRQAFVRKRAIEYLQTMDPGIEGHRGSNPTYTAARAMVYGFDLGVEEGLALLLAHYNPKCVPPWSEAELRHKCADANSNPFDKPRGWLLSGGGVVSARRLDRASRKPAPGSSGERIIQRASEVKATVVEWLWPGRIPLAKLTTFAGQTSQGKTFVACDIAARVSRGLPWPDGQPARVSGQVLFITGDDDADDTLVPRLLEADAEMGRIVFLTEKAQAEWTMAALSSLDVALDQGGNEFCLVVIDPPTSFLAGIDEHKNAEVRSLLTPFKDWAKRHRVAVVLITHVNKGGGLQVEAMSRVMGSVAWVSGVRTAYMFVPDEDGDRQLFLTLKNNLAPKSKGLAYRIVTGESVGRVEWLGEVDTTADQAMRNGHGKKEPRGRVASEWMIERFRERQEWDSETLFSQAKQEGISRSAIFEAKRTLGLPKARKRTAVDGSISWVWWVPEDWPQLSCNGKHEPLKPLGVTQGEIPF